MFENNGHYCCDNFHLTQIQFSVAIRQAVQSNTEKEEAGISIGVEQKLTDKREETK